VSDEQKTTLPPLNSAAQVRRHVEWRDIDVPEWGGSVRVQELTAAEKDEMNSFMFEIDGSDYTLNMQNATTRLVVFSVRDADGNRLWPNTKKGIAEVATLGSAGCERVAEVARELSKMTKESRKRVEGNSRGTSNGARSSDTPSPSEVAPLPS
jgi:hypothetical protein